MRVHVNLATRPFVELRPYFLRLRIIMGALAVVAVALALVVHSMKRKLAEEKQQMDQTHAAIVATQQQKNRAERRMHQPDNAAVLERAHFLNSLFLRKSFSWTAVMMDLETVLPIGVQVTSIEPQVTPDGDVVIRLRVSGERDRAVQLVRNLEHSRRFLHPRLAGEASQAKENAQGAPQANNGAPAGVEFDILADYNPLPANESYHFASPRVQTGFVPDARTLATAKPLTAPAQSVVMTPRPLPANGRFPRDGVVLKPYAAPHSMQRPGGTR